MTDTPSGSAGAGRPESPEPAAAAAAAAAAGPGPGPRKPRKAFLLVGVVLAVVLGIFLFTGLGTSQGSTGSGAPHAGTAVPSFSAPNIGPSGPHQVSVPTDGGSNGQPAVLLFFGAWCPSCHQELPPLAAAVRSQDKAGGALAQIRVIGVDSEDTVGNAKRFIKSAGVTFPVAYDPDVNITSGLFYLTGDPYAVFVRGDGTIAEIVRGDKLTPSMLTAYERALIPRGT
ncbi:MAG TPA: TlpA disulfide reductase family protein [Acidimicrobiales bacterium]